MDCFYCERAFPADCALSGNLVSNDGFLHVRRRMGSNVLIYVLEGTLYIAGNGVRREVKEGQLLLLPGGEEPLRLSVIRRTSFLFLDPF